MPDMATHAVVGTGFSTKAVIEESLRDILKDGDVLVVEWAGKPSEGTSTVYDYILDNNVPFVMLHTEEFVPPKVFMRAEHGTISQAVDPLTTGLRAIDKGGRALVLWDEDDEAGMDLLVGKVFDNVGPTTLVLELTNGLAPISLSLASAPTEEATPAVSPVEEDDPTDSLDETEKLSRAELEIMPGPALKRLATATGNLPEGVTGKANYIKVILGEELPESALPFTAAPPAPKELTPEQLAMKVELEAMPEVEELVAMVVETGVPVTIADSDPTMPVPAGWNPSKGDEAHAQLRKSLLNQTPNQHQINTIEDFRKVALTLGDFIIDNIPVGRNRSLAITALEDVVMRGVKGILLDA